MDKNVILGVEGLNLYDRAGNHLVKGVSLSLMAVQYTGAGIASTLMALTPVLILFPYAFLYKERIRAREIIGVLVSMTGVALFFLL